MEIRVFEATGVRISIRRGLLAPNMVLSAPGFFGGILHRVGDEAPLDSCLWCSLVSFTKYWLDFGYLGVGFPFLICPNSVKGHFIRKDGVYKFAMPSLPLSSIAFFNECLGSSMIFGGLWVLLDPLFC